MYVIANRAPRRSRGMAGLGSFDWGALLNDVTNAYSNVTQAQTAQKIAEAQAATTQAQLQAQQQALALQSAMRAQAATAPASASVGGMSMGTILLLGGVALAAFMLMRD